MFEIAQTPTWRRTQLAAWHPRFDDPNEHLMFIRGFNAETGNPFCCVQHTDTRGEITIRVLGLNDERLSGPRLDAYKEGYDAMSEVFEWIKRLRDPRPDVAPAIKLSLRRSKEEVNRIWNGEKAYTAFGRLGIIEYGAYLQAAVRTPIELPLPLD